MLSIISNVLTNVSHMRSTRSSEVTRIAEPSEHLDRNQMELVLALTILLS